METAVQRVLIGGSLQKNITAETGKNKIGTYVLKPLLVKLGISRGLVGLSYSNEDAAAATEVNASCHPEGESKT